MLKCFMEATRQKGGSMEADIAEVFSKKRKAAYVKAKYWVRCLDCRAIYSDRVASRYPTCKFCGGANWSND